MVYEHFIVWKQCTKSLFHKVHWRRRHFEKFKSQHYLHRRNKRSDFFSRMGNKNRNLRSDLLFWKVETRTGHLVIFEDRSCPVGRTIVSSSHGVGVLEHVVSVTKRQWDCSTSGHQALLKIREYLRSNRHATLLSLRE